MSAVTATPPVRQRWLVPALIVVVSLMVGGGFLARELYRQQGQETDVAVTAPTSSSLPLDQQPGPGTVALTPDAAGHPLAETIHTLLQLYFDAINGLDYEKWKTVVTKERIQNKPKDQWKNDYKSSRDGSIVLYRIEAVSEERLQMFLGFTSTQNQSDAPPDFQEGCIRWRITLPVAWQNGQWKLETASSATTPERSRC